MNTPTTHLRQIGLTLAVALFALGFVAHTGSWNLVPAVAAQEKVSAQEITPTTTQRFTLSVNPGTGFVKVAPGGSAMHSITVRNKSTRPVTLKPRLVDFVSDGKTGTPILTDTSSFSYLANQAEFLEPITIEANQQAVIPLLIKPPSTALPHEYHISVLFENQGELQTGGTSALVPSIASNVVVLVADTVSPAGLKILSLQNSRVVDSFRTLSFKPLAENPGQMAVIASGSAIVRDWRGHQVSSQPIYPDIVLAQSKRELRSAVQAKPVLPDDPSASIATLLDPVPFSYKEPMLLGAYTIEFHLENTDSEGTTSAIQSFTVYAFPFSAVAIIGVTAGILLTIRLIKRKKLAQKPLSSPPQPIT